MKLLTDALSEAVCVAVIDLAFEHLQRWSSFFASEKLLRYAAVNGCHLGGGHWRDVTIVYCLGHVVQITLLNAFTTQLITTIIIINK